MSTDAVNSAQIAMLIESNSEIKSMHVETNRNINTLIEFQIRTEERRVNEEEWRKRIEIHNDKQDVKIDDAQKTANDASTQALFNSKWIMAAYGLVIFISGIIATAFITKWVD